MAPISDAAQVLLDALDALPDPAWCVGRVPASATITLAIPEGSRSLDAADLETWLMAHGEPAPFGDATGTRHDPHVRVTRRLKARAATRIEGFEPAGILGEIERELAADCRLGAELLDVLVYTPGSKFVSHKDTPRSDDQLGTLVVELPHEHLGGELELVDGDRTELIDWSAVEPGTVRWVALFGDVDHEIRPVTDGMRITAVYTLRYRAEDRLPAVHRERLDVVIDAAIALHDGAGEQLAIPCGRMIVAPRDAMHPLPHSVLRGGDRLIAAALERAGIAVAVRACVVVANDEDAPLADAIDEAMSYRRAVLLNGAIPDEVLRGANAISWDPEADGEAATIAMIAPYVDPEAFPSRTWLIRKRVRIRGDTMLFSHTGYFGNEYGAYYVYRFAMMLANVPACWDR